MVELNMQELVFELSLAATECIKLSSVYKMHQPGLFVYSGDLQL